MFLTADPHRTPTALLHSLKHYKVLHEQNVILSVVTAQTPRVPEHERVQIEGLNPLFMRVTMKFGLYGAAERAERPRYQPQAWLEIRHHDDVVLPVAPDSQGLG